MLYFDFFRYKKEFVVSGVVKFVNTLVQFFPSILIAQLLKSLSSTDQTAWTIPMLQQVKNPKGVVLAVLLYLCLCAKTTVENQYFDMVTVLGAQIRGTLSAAIYQKSLKLSPTGRQFNTVSAMSAVFTHCNDIYCDVYFSWARF